MAAAVKEMAPGTDVVFYGTRQGLEQRVLSAAGYPMRRITARGFLGKGPVDRMLFPVWLGLGIVQSLFHMARSRPGVVLGTGGYVSAPPVIAAWMLRVPVALLALDAMPSRAVRMLAPLARQVYGGFPECSKYLKPGTEVIPTGNPIRAEIGRVSKEQGAGRFGLDSARRTVLVFGGSQGAHRINLAMLDALGHFHQTGQLKDLQVIFQTGSRDYRLVSEAAGRISRDIRVLEYINDMAQALAAADLAVCRSGAGVSEVLAGGLPAILVPFPHAASNHQEYNARSLERAGAAEVILDRDLEGKMLAERIAAIIDDPQRQRRMRAAALSLARPEAAAEIARNILALAEG